MNKKLFYITFFSLTVIIFSYFMPANEKDSSGKKEILSTTVMIDSLVKEIVQDKFVTKLLIEGEIDPHSYQMRKGDKEKLKAASIVFSNGLSLEHNPSLLYHLKDKRAAFLGDQLLSEHPELIITRNREIDPHIWMDLDLMQKVADMICDRVILEDAENAEFYEQNVHVLKQRMGELDLKIRAMIQDVPEENRYLVSSHDAFNYFVRRYFTIDEERRLFSMQGLSPEAEISLKRMSQVIDFIKNHRVHAIFYESNLPKDSLWKVLEVCKSFGIDVKMSKEALYGDTLGGMTYLEMMEHNASVISKHLKAEGENE